MMNRLAKKILKSKKKEVKDIRRSFSEDLLKAAAFSVGGEFRSIEISVQQHSGFPLFVELKRRLLPGMEELDGMEPLKMTNRFLQLGLESGVVISTDREFLGGDPSWLNLIKQTTELPILQRDFFIDAAQVYQSKAIGADAVIINDFLQESKRLPGIFEAAAEMGLETLLEVETPELPTGVIPEMLMGVVVDSDLSTLKANQDAWLNFLQGLPERIVRLSRTFPGSVEDVIWLQEMGFQGLILNDDFWRAQDVFTCFKEIQNWCVTLPANS